VRKECLSNPEQAASLSCQALLRIAHIPRFNLFPRNENKLTAPLRGYKHGLIKSYSFHVTEQQMAPFAAGLAAAKNQSAFSVHDL